MRKWEAFMVEWGKVGGVNDRQVCDKEEQAVAKVKELTRLGYSSSGWSLATGCPVKRS